LRQGQIQGGGEFPGGIFVPGIQPGEFVARLQSSFIKADGDELYGSFGHFLGPEMTEKVIDAVLTTFRKENWTVSRESSHDGPYFQFS